MIEGFENRRIVPDNAWVVQALDLGKDSFHWNGQTLSPDGHVSSLIVEYSPIGYKVVIKSVGEKGERVWELATANQRSWMYTPRDFVVGSYAERINGAQPVETIISLQYRAREEAENALPTRYVSEVNPALHEVTERSLFASDAKNLIRLQQGLRQQAADSLRILDEMADVISRSYQIV